MFKKIFIALFFFISIKSQCADKFIMEDTEYYNHNNILMDKKFTFPNKIINKINKYNIFNILNTLFEKQKFNNIETLKNIRLFNIKAKNEIFIRNIVFSGNKLINQEILSKKLEKYNIKKGSIFIPNKIFKFQESMYKIYFKYGKFNIIVKAIKNIKNNNIDLKFNFIEGKTTLINKINFHGNKSFTDRQLQNIFHFSETIFLKKFLNTKKYNFFNLLEGIHKLNKFYKNNGFLNFKINNYYLKLSENRNLININLKFTENKKYYISPDYILNNPLCKYNNDIKNLININNKEIYQKNKIDKIEKKIKFFLKNKGYAFPNIKIRLNTNRFSNVISLHINVNPGEKFYIKNIYFKGNIITRDKVLIRELEQLDNTSYYDFLSKRSLNNLKKLNLFNNINMELVPVLNTKNKMDIIYKLEEKKFNNFNFGINTDNVLSVIFDIAKDNLFGLGYGTKLNFIKGAYNTKAKFLTHIPHINKNISKSEFIIFLNSFDNSSDIKLDYNIKNIGIKSKINFPFENSNLSLRIKYLHQHLKDILPYTSNIKYINSIINIPKRSLDIKNLYIKNNDFLYKIIWHYNSLNNEYFPDKGKNIYLLGKVTFPFSNNSYYKLILDIKYIYSISKHFILYNKMFLGLTSGIRGKEVPFYENFTISNSKQIRGFNINNLEHKNIKIKSMKNIFPKVKFCNPTIGNTIFISNIELILPIHLIYQKFINSFRAILFLDIGDIWDIPYYDIKIFDLINMNFNTINKNFNFNNIRSSFGIALNYISKYGLLSISFANPIKKHEGDDIQKLQFNFTKSW